MSREEAGEWWFNFAARWGDTASLVALTLTLFGFLFTWWMQARTNKAVRQALWRVALQSLAFRLNTTHHLLVGALEAGDVGEEHWLRCYDRCREAKQSILFLIGNPLLQREENDDLRTSASDFRDVIEYIRRRKVMQVDRSAHFQPQHRRVLESLIDLVCRIQARLGNQAWEGQHG